MPPNRRPEASFTTVSAGDLLARGGTLLTATHRLARQIRRAHDQAMAASGAEAWPSPDILPLDAWLRRTWESLAVCAAPVGQHRLEHRPAHRMERRLLTDDECRVVWGRILAAEAAGADMALIAPLAASGWRLCQLWGITPAELHQAADTDDARAFARWVDAYRQRLAECGWLDSAALLTSLPAVLAESSITKSPIAGSIISGAAVGFAGFASWTPAVTALATALELQQVAVCHIETAPRHERTRIIAARDEVDELAQAFHWAAGLISRNPGAAVAILVGSLEQQAAAARRIGLDVLAPGWQLHEPAARPVALAAGRQLTDFPVVNTALAVLRLLVGSSTFEEVSQVLRSPYITGAVNERTGRALTELRLREYPLESIRASDLPRLLHGKAPVIAGLWAAAVALTEAVRGQRLLPSHWAGHFSAWLTAAGWPGDRGLASEEHQAAEAWQVLLSAFAATDDVAGRLTLPAALGHLARQAHDRAFEPESAEGAVQVVSLGEAAGQAFDGLWITGLTADQWPAPAHAHALIPLSLQRAAGIPEAAAATQEKALRLQLTQLMAAAVEVVLSWPAEREGAIQLASPILHDERVTGPVSAEEADATAPGAHPLRDALAASSLGAAAAVETADDCPSALPVGRTPTRLSGGSRVLAMQAVCPARAFIEFRLRGTELRAPARLLDPANRGRLLHRLLEQLYGLEACRTGLGKLDQAGLRAQFASVIDTVLDEFLPATEPFCAGLRPLEAERLWTQLQALHALDADRPDFTVATEVSREVQIGALLLKLRLDRIDHLVDGGELVIDYKTGAFQPAGWKKGRLQDSQLPLYAVTDGARGVAVVQILPLGARLVGVGERTLAVAGMKSPDKFFKDEALEWPAVLERWQRQLESLATEFAAGDFRVNPADRSHAVGQYASVTRIFECQGGDGEEDAEPEAGE